MSVVYVSSIMINVHASRNFWSKIQEQTPEVFCKKKVFLNKFHKIHRKTPVSESFLLKKRLWDRCFPVNFVKFLRTPFLQDTSRQRLLKDNSASVHHYNIHILVIEMYKVINGMSPEIMNDAFKLRDETHHLRHTTQFPVDPILRVFNGIESALYLGPKIWEQIPTETENKDSPVGFKKEIRKWKLLNCPLCLTIVIYG